MWKNITNLILVLVILVMIYFNRNQTREISIQKAATEAARDTIHNFKTAVGSTGGYISVIQTDKSAVVALLKLEKDKNKNLIALLDSNKTVVRATEIETNTRTIYESKVDTIYKDLDFSHTIKTDWRQEDISIKKGVFKSTLDYRDAYIYHEDKKDNKGLWTGSTLTTYVEPMNPETKVTGLKSFSTVVDKRKPRLGAYVGAGLSLDKQGLVKPAIQVGIGLTF